MLDAVSDFISKVTRGEKIRVDGVEAQWKKVSELTPGMRIAAPAADVIRSFNNDIPWENDQHTSMEGTDSAKYTSDGMRMHLPRGEESENGDTDVHWDEIVSIKRLPPERVYDIEVEGTHNFVAGHLLEVSLPKTSRIITDEPLRGPPQEVSDMLSKDKTISATENRWYGGFFAHNTYISGNLGIGTTGPTGLLNLKGTLSSALTGTVAVTNLSTAVVGTGTLFTTELAVGDSIKIGSEIFTVSAITDALNLTLDSAYQGTTASGLTAYRDPTLLAIDNGDAVNKLTITKSGNVGIGTTAPAKTLDVGGDINFTGGIYVSGGAQGINQANLRSTQQTDTQTTACNGTNSGSDKSIANTYVFLPTLRVSLACTGATSAGISSLGTSENGTTQGTAYWRLTVNVPGSGAGNGSAESQIRYLQASPPYYIDGVLIPDFIYALWDKNTGFISSVSEAEDPPWELSGRTPDQLSHRFPDYLNKSLPQNLEIAMINPGHIEEWKNSAKKYDVTLATYINQFLRVDPNPATPPLSPQTGQPIRIPGGGQVVWRNMIPQTPEAIAEAELGIQRAKQMENSAPSSSLGAQADLAELYPSAPFLSPGDIVEPKLAHVGDAESQDPLKKDNLVLVKTTQSNSPKAVGVISSNPAQVINEGDSDGQLPLALSGRVPVKVSNLGGPIKIGDPITSSIIPGIGMKSQKAGTIVGKALEEFDPQNGKGEILPCPDGAPDGTLCGKILMFVNVSWFDPDVYLTSTGDLMITSADQLTASQAAQLSTESAQLSFQLLDSAGNIISRVAALSDAAIANLKAGYISAQQLFTENLVATGSATIGKVNTNLIAPLPDQNLTIDLSNPHGTSSASGQLNIVGQNNQNVVSIDNSGNATFSGTLQAQNGQFADVIMQQFYNTGDATVSGTLTVGQLNTGNADLAENYVAGDPNIQSGDVVAISDTKVFDANGIAVTNKGVLQKTSTPYDPRLIGVISTNPGLVLGDSNSSKTYQRSLALSGRVPIKIDPNSPPIHIGDFLTSGTTPGMAIKATKPGLTVAKALESWMPDSGRDQIEAFVNLGYYDPDLELTSIGDLQIFSSGSSNLHYALFDATGGFISRIGAFSDAAIAHVKAGLVESKELIVEGSANVAGNLKAGFISAQEFLGETARFTSATISNLSILSDLTVGGKLISPIVETEALKTRDLIATGTAELNRIKTGMLSPLEDNQDIVVKLGKENTASGSAGAETPFGRLLIQNQNNQTVASIDTGGNATFSGQLSADSLSISNLSTLGNLSVGHDTTVAGTLYADQIESKQLKGLQSSFGELLGKVDLLNGKIATATPTIIYITPSAIPLPTVMPTAMPSIIPADLTLTPTEAPATPSALSTALVPIPTPTIADLTSGIASPSGENQATDAASLLGRLTQFLRSTNSLRDRMDTFIATSSTTVAPNAIPNPSVGVQLNNDFQLASPQQLPQNLRLSSLSVSGSSSLADTSISGQLLVDGSILIENNKIASLGDTLYLNALNTVNIFGGNFVLDQKGNLTITGELIAKNGISTGRIRPDGQDLTIDLSEQITPTQSATLGGFGKLLIQGAGDTTVTSIDTNGNIITSGGISAKEASISGALTAERFNIIRNEIASTSTISSTLTASDNQSQNGINAPGIKTVGSAGSGILPAGSQEIVVFNQNITDRTLIYITPTSPTQNRTLYVADKKPGAYFIIALDTPVSIDVKFNWWIIN